MFAVAAWLFPGSALSQAATPPALRLPDTVQPRHYAVELTILPAETSFRGSIDITLEVMKPTNIIWLNARYLTVELARIEGAGAPAQANIVPGGEDFVGLQFDHALALANGVDYALTGGVYSRSPANIKKAAEAFEVGNLYVNRPITGALVGRQPFGGFRLSGVGSKAGGPDYLPQFLLPKSWSENTTRHGFAPGIENP